jgi:hypothetical protein
MVVPCLSGKAEKPLRPPIPVEAGALPIKLTATLVKDFGPRQAIWEENTLAAGNIDRHEFIIL